MAAGPERELLNAAIRRHLAAHCPTRRSSSQSVAVTLRLQKGKKFARGNGRLYKLANFVVIASEGWNLPRYRC
jgi:hypothetical protein